MRYGSLISNTDRTGQHDTHWSRIIDIHPKNPVFIFDSLGMASLKNFIISDHNKVINNIFFGLEKF